MAQRERSRKRSSPTAKLYIQYIATWFVRGIKISDSHSTDFWNTFLTSWNTFSSDLNLGWITNCLEKLTKCRVGVIIYEIPSKKYISFVLLYYVIPFPQTCSSKELLSLPYLYLCQPYQYLYLPFLIITLIWWSFLPIIIEPRACKIR